MIASCFPDAVPGQVVPGFVPGREPGHVAQARIMPVSGGSFINYTGKATPGLPAAPGLSHQAQAAASECAIARGIASTLLAYAAKQASAAGVLLQWA
jgi:hypothetical protein